MTTRRGFLGLIAAAPVVMPEVVTQIGAEMIASKFASGGFVHGAAKLETLSLNVEWDKPDPDSIARLRQLMRAPTLWSEEAAPITPLQPRHVRRLRELQALGPVPNRLYGATINQQGEAI